MRGNRRAELPALDSRIRGLVVCFDQVTAVAGVSRIEKLRSRLVARSRGAMDLCSEKVAQDGERVRRNQPDDSRAQSEG